MSKPYADVEQWLKTNKPTARGMCLNTSMRSYGASGMGASDATEASGKTKDLQTKYTTNIPAGAHVLYSGGSQGHGHSVVSDGGGYVYTVDWYSGLNITRVKQTDMENAWGNLKWGGWSKYYGSQPLDIVGDDPDPKPPTPEPEDDDVPDYYSKTTSTDMSIGVETWKTLKLSDDGDISLAFGACLFEAEVQITASGVPSGEYVIVRFYQCDTKSGSDTKRVSEYRQQKLWGSGLTGAAVQIGQLKNAASGWQRRLRAEVYTKSSGVVITSAEGRCFTWK